MTDEELIARLRKYEDDLLSITADRIEALIAERDEAMQLLKTLSNMNGDLSRDLYKTKLLLAKAVEALLWCSGSADFNEGGVAREGWLKVCAPLLKGESHD